MLIGDVVVGVAEGAWLLEEGAWPLGAVDENSSQADVTSRLCVSFSS